MGKFESYPLTTLASRHRLSEKGLILHDTTNNNFPKHHGPKNNQSIITVNLQNLQNAFSIASHLSLQTNYLVRLIPGTMAAPNPLPPPSQSPSQHRAAEHANLITYTSLGALLVCPLLIALPPRKFDFYTVLLISGTALGGNQLLREYTGRGIAERVPTLARLGLASERAGEIQERLRERGIDERVGRRDFGTENERARLGNGIAGSRAVGGPGTGTTGAVARAVQEMKAAEATQEPARESQDSRALPSQDTEAGEEVPRRRKADWKAARDAREKEALEEGRGYGGLIVDQIWEVWNWGRGSGDGDDKTEEIREGDEKGMDGKGKGGRK